MSRTKIVILAKQMFKALGYAGILVSIFLFMTGFHNVDLSTNMLRVSYYEDLDYSRWRDTTMHGVKEDYDTIYIMGMVQMLGAFVLLLCSAIIMSVRY